MKTPDHILWFFSTCAQTFAALVSVFGMFVLYRLQIEEGRIGSIRERMLRHDEAHLKLPFEAILESLNQKAHDSRLRGDLHHSETIRTLIKNYGGAIGKRAWLSRQARYPMVSLLLLTFWSLAALTLFPYLGTSALGILLVWLTLAVCTIPLYQVGAIIVVSISLD